MDGNYHHGNLKNDLIETAIKIISDGGVERLSLRSLSQRCGVSHNAIYRHFDSKEAMINRCREYVTEGLMNYLNKSIEGMNFEDPQTIYKLSYSYIDYFRKRPSYFEFIYNGDAHCKIIFSLNKVENNYPPFEIFRKICLALIKKYELSREEGLRRLVKYWAIMQGTVSLIISPDVTLDGDWDMCLKNIFLIGGK